jgi:hypothetical protein
MPDREESWTVLDDAGEVVAPVEVKGANNHQVPRPSDWARIITEAVTGQERVEPQAEGCTLDFRRYRTSSKRRADPKEVLEDGSRL